MSWEELNECEPGDFTLKTMPQRFKDIGDVHHRMDETAYSLDSLLELSLRDERGGLGDAPWPPHYRKQRGEPARVQPSRKKSEGRRKKSEG